MLIPGSILNLNASGRTGPPQLAKMEKVDYQSIIKRMKDVLQTDLADYNQINIVLNKEYNTAYNSKGSIQSDQ